MAKRYWVQTAFGGRVHIPTEDSGVPAHEIRINDIAYQLAGQTRFNGGLRLRFSVAQHSLWVSEAVLHASENDPVAALYGLLHDGHEAIIGDLVSPVKWTMPPAVRAWWDDLVNQFDKAIFEQAGLDLVMPNEVAELVAEADQDALIAEATEGFRGGMRADFARDVGAAPFTRHFTIAPFKEVSIEEAATDFLKQYQRLQGLRLVAP